MLQQVNLYQAGLRKREDKLTANRFVQGLLSFFAGLVVVYGGFYWYVSAKEQTLIQIQAQHVASINSLEEEMRRHTPVAMDEQLVKRLAQLDKELTNKKQVLDALSGKVLGNTRGFAEHFTGIARRRVEGMWLTGLTIAEGGTQLGLKGSSLKPELVPRFLQALSLELAFAGTEFKTFRIVRPEDHPTQVDFDIQTVAQDER